MATRTLALLIISLLALVACERSDETQPAPAVATEPVPAVSPDPEVSEPSFVNRVWAVAESRQVAVGDLRTFLSDGTLVVTSSHATPAFGTWRYDGERLTIVEEGREYPTDILELTEASFRIRMNGPGEPVEILFAPAEQVPPDPVQVAPRVAAAPAAAALWGTGWKLESLLGGSVVDRIEATIEFPSQGRASGNGSCNRFNGVVTIEGEVIRFGGIAATRKACPDAVMRQEDAYFTALRGAESFETDGQTLRIFSASQPEPLRFVASQVPATPAVNQISRARATEMPTLTGIWTVVAHHSPGAGALNDDQARARYGETLRLTADAANSPGNRCNEPAYAAQSVPAQAFLAGEYQLAPGSLKPFAGRNQLRFMDVSCDGAPWAAFGGRLLEIDRDRALAPWDGVFFELMRDRDFRAVGQEPGWQLEIRQGAEMRFTFDYGRNSAVTPAARVQVDPGTGTRTYHAVAEANDLRVEIVPVSCTDSMSGRAFAATVTVTLNGRSYRGCGENLATPYQG